MNDQLNKLIRMANDIARNLGAGKPEEQAAEEIAAHINKFWAPAMRAQLKEAVSEIDEDTLLPTANIALSKIRSD